MGGLDIDTAKDIGTGTASMLSRSRQAKQYRKSLNETYAAQYKQRQNLLNKQLANHRANLGSMGITGSASSNAVAQRMVSDSYDDINQDFNNYKNKYTNFAEKQQSDLNRRIIDGISATTSQMIK